MRVRTRGGSALPENHFESASALLDSRGDRVKDGEAAAAAATAGRRGFDEAIRAAALTSTNTKWNVADTESSIH